MIAYSRSKPALADLYDTFIHGDIRDADALKTAARGCDTIIHLACFPLADESQFNQNYEVNTIGTLNALHAAQSAGCERLIFSSTAQVIGIAEKLPIAEEVNCKPRSHYGASKLLAEILCQSYVRNYGLCCVILRFFNVYGPSLTGQKRNTIEEMFIRNLLANQTPQITSHPDEARDFIFIDDSIRAIANAASLEAELDSGIYNIGTGRMTAFPELAKIINHILHKDILPEIRSEGQPEAMRLQADTSKSEKHRILESNTSLENGLESLINHYLKNGAINQ